MTALCLPHNTLADSVWRNWLPREPVVSWDWIAENVRDKDKRPFDQENVPWCRGVCEAFDSKRFRQIVLQWASRLGKTLISQSLALCTWATNPMPSIFASSTEDLAKKIVREKLYPMLAGCPALAYQLKSPARRSLDRIELAECHARVAWSGSDSTLADFSAWLVHANEADKFSEIGSDEGDSLDLLLERCKEFPDYKALIESTPRKRRSSRVERFRLMGTNSRYWVPCPRCRRFQVLKLGNGDPTLGGIIFDHLPDGSTAPDLALRTARYVCEHCRGEIHSDQRARMMRAGVWADDGCWIGSNGRLQGNATRGGDIWSSQLSSLYSLQLSWGKIAAQFLKARTRKKSWQNFVNSWKGETYDEAEGTIEPHELGARLRTDRPRGLVPAGVAFLTAGVDVQKNKFVFYIVGWGEEERGHLIDWGECATFADVLRLVVNREFASTEADVPAYRVRLTFIDSSAMTRKVYKFVKENHTVDRPILAIKGSDQLGVEPFRKVRLGSNRKRKVSATAQAFAGMTLILVNVPHWQPEIQESMDSLKPGDPGSHSFPIEASVDLDLCQQLLNNQEIEKLDRNGFMRMIWVKRDPEAPDDYRDAFKYARAAAEYFLMRKWDRVLTMLEEHLLSGSPDGSVTDASDDETPDSFVRRPGWQSRTDRGDEGDRE